MTRPYPIPARRNLALVAATLATLVTVLALGGAGRGAGTLLALALIYGVAMNTGYALIHEAEHGILHPRPAVNLWCGIVLALFFPAPFHLIRQGHLGHHQRNRSDDEAFDFYFDGESALWRWLQLYGVLTGLFWATIALSNALAALWPALLRARAAPFDYATTSLQASLNPRFDGWIRGEAIAVFLLHGALAWTFGIPLAHHAAMLFGFGFLWSAMQYAHHWQTERHVLRGARNLRTFAVLDALWLNHNWHLNHHLHPTVPWLYLPGLSAPEEKRGSLAAAYFRMWRGPRYSAERVENRFAGRIIQ